MKTKSIIITLSLALFLCPLKPKAQTYTTGITAGVSKASVNFSDMGTSLTSAIKGKNIMGFEGGLFERFNFNMLFFKPMLLVSYQGGTVTYYNNDGSLNTEKFKEGSIEVPLLLGISIVDILRLEAGPEYNWIYSTRFNNDNSIKVNPSGFGYRVGANIEFGILNLGFAYQGLIHQSNNSSTVTFSTPNELIFSVALCFGGHNKDKK